MSGALGSLLGGRGRLQAAPPPTPPSPRSCVGRGAQASWDCCTEPSLAAGTGLCSHPCTGLTEAVSGGTRPPPTPGPLLTVLQHRPVPPTPPGPGGGRAHLLTQTCRGAVMTEVGARPCWGDRRETGDEEKRDGEDGQAGRPGLLRAGGQGRRARARRPTPPPPGLSLLPPGLCP